MCSADSKFTIFKYIQQTDLKLTKNRAASREVNKSNFNVRTVPEQNWAISRHSSSALKRVLRPASGHHHLLPSSFCFSFDSSPPRLPLNFKALSLAKIPFPRLSLTFRLKRSCLDRTEGIFDPLQKMPLS